MSCQVFRGLTALALSFSLLAACGEKPAPEAHGDEHAEAGADDERGPHKGRLLRDGAFAIEITIFEAGVEPEFRLYAYRKDKPVDPKTVQVSVELTRLGGKIDRFAFTPEGDHLRGGGVVAEPHSFDVKVRAVENGATHAWTYASYEGRTTISAPAAQAGGVRTEVAGPAMIGEFIDLSGRVEITPEGKAEVRAWYPGRILLMRGELGQSVRKGQVLARVESNHSLQAYSIPAPISGVIIEKNATVGGMAGDQPLFVVADPTQLHAEFFVFPRDADRIR
ncbi:MAG: HlyD family efflux transporter periplasmic adaptor subunit, partial [Phenylobacterium sp.]|nr:HlyD family efflux transporter periplasmic adaptor subunit [Phenylobacterium sp.]